MDWFKNKSIRTKLIIGFSLMIAFMVIVGISGYRSSTNIQGNLLQIYHEQLPAIDKLIEADRDLQQLLVAERSMIYTQPGSADFQAFLDAYQENLGQSKTRWNAYKQLAFTQVEKDIVVKFERAFADWEAVSKQVVENWQKNTPESRALAMSLTTGEAAERFEFMRDFVDQLTELKLDMASRSEASASDAYSDNIVTLIFMLVLGLVAVAVMMVSGTRLISNPLMQITAVAKRIAHGDLDSELHINRGDEIGQLASAFRAMSDSLKEKAEAANALARGDLGVAIAVASNEDILGQSLVTMKENLNRLIAAFRKTIDAQIAGDLDARCVVAGLDGAFGELVGGVNATIDAISKPMEECIVILKDYAGGDLEHKMRDLPGKQESFSKSVNLIRENLRVLIGESVALAKAAQQGDLGARGDASRFKG
ncbi:MAG: MCP four helix bundle domain-containing protein, partial [Calditrichaeota bacterium]|nr:MCP four helix bundle domain-containing protein [Calditrichota bacterium]